MDPAVSNATKPFQDPQRLSNESLQDSIAELDRREAWGEWGVKSCAHWLNWRCGIGLGAAREKVRVARALGSLPLISEALASGSVSYSKVRAMTRIATAENEDYLLMIARHGTASHVEGLVRSYRRVQRNESTAVANEEHALRELNWYWGEDGSLVINARLPAESGAVVLKALEAALDEINTEELNKNVSAETFLPEKPFAARRADALTNIAGEYLSDGSHAVRQAERYQVVVHVDSDTLREDGANGLSEVEHGPALCPETARRIACDTSFVELDTDERGEPLNIGRKTRTVPPSMRRALERRDRGCRFPGCTDHRYVDAHHIHHWADGGETSTRNLVLLCRHHHRLIHEGGFSVIRRDDEKLLFFTPRGVLIPEVVAPTAPETDVATVVRERGKNVSAETLTPMWHGEVMDMGMAVDGLISPGTL